MSSFEVRNPCLILIAAIRIDHHSMLLLAETFILFLFVFMSSGHHIGHASHERRRLELVHCIKEVITITIVIVCHRDGIVVLDLVTAICDRI